MLRTDIMMGLPDLNARGKNMDPSFLIEHSSSALEAQYQPKDMHSE